MKALLAAAQEAVLARLAHGRVLLAFDFDGTLAPIVADRDRARMAGSTARLLARLAALYPCAVISGRALADLRERVPGIPLAYLVGNHGLEPSKLLTKARRVTREARRALGAEVARWPGVELEDKAFSLAIHYRNTRRKLAARRALRAASSRLPIALRLVAGKDVLNLVPADAPDKGQALRQLQRRARATTVLYVGDDVTDEDVFRANWGETLIGARVGRHRASAAAFFLGRQGDIDRLLSKLIALREAPRVAGAKRGRDAHLEPTLAFLKNLWQLNHALERLSSRMQATLGVTAQQRVVLRLVAQLPALTAAELSALLHLDPGTISSALQRLEKKRLLSRRRDESDARRSTLHLTERAEVLNRPHPVTVEAAVEHLLRKSSAHERRIAGLVLEKLTAALEMAAASSEGIGGSRRARPAAKRPRAATR